MRREGKKEEVKTLATCSDREFMQQANKIRKAVANWFSITEIQKIRSILPKYEEIPKDATSEETEEILERNKKLQREQGLKNLNLILDAVLEDHPDETIEIIRLCCFVDPKDETKSVRHYMQAFIEMFNDETVIDFFLSLRNLGQTFGLTL